MIRFFILFFSLVVLYSCGDSNEQNIAELESLIERRLANLNQALEQNSLSNATKLKFYAQSLKQTKPELSSLLDELLQVTKADNFQIEQFKIRLNDLRSMPNNDTKLEDLMYLSEAVLPSAYNASLIDQINAIATFSSGTLPLVDVDKDALNDGQEAGSTLVGNPGYGYWNGGFWFWYGQYRLISDLFWGRSYSYDRWRRSGGWNYYRDYSPGKTRPKPKDFSPRRNRSFLQNRSYQTSSKTSRQTRYTSSLRQNQRSRGIFRGK